MFLLFYETLGCCDKAIIKLPKSKSQPEIPFVFSCQKKRKHEKIGKIAGLLHCCYHCEIEPNQLQLVKSYASLTKPL